MYDMTDELTTDDKIPIPQGARATPSRNMTGCPSDGSVGLGFGVSLGRDVMFSIGRHSILLRSYTDAYIHLRCSIERYRKSSGRLLELYDNSFHRLELHVAS